MTIPSAPGPAPMPEFLRPLAERARRGERLLLPRTMPGTGTAPAFDETAPPTSAVLLLLVGESLERSRVLVHERGRTLRSQPGQIALPGGRIEADDPTPVDAALREASEEVLLRRADITVHGAFAPVPMPRRRQMVAPVLAWAPAEPPVGIGDPVEVERVSWLPLTGPVSLTDPARIHRGLLDGRDVGPVFDLPGGDTVWGFTARLLAAVLEGLGLELPDDGEDAREIPQRLRW